MYKSRVVIDSRSFPRGAAFERTAADVRWKRATTTDSITPANEFIRTRPSGFAIVSYLNELSNVFSLNTTCDENHRPVCVAETHFAAAVNINKKRSL